MTTDYRALCAELADRLQRAITSSKADRFYGEDRDALDRARAALAKPVPQGPTDLRDETLLNEADAYFLYGEGKYTASLEEVVAFARRVFLAGQSCGRPAIEPEGPLEHDWLPELRGHFERILCVARSSGGRTVGNIELADRLIDAVVPVSHRWGRPTIAPIPLSERLPGPEDCMDEGWAWFYTPRGDWVKAVLPLSPAYTHWLPHHALPVPTPS